MINYEEIEITEDDWIFGEVLNNPVLFREFINVGSEEWYPLEDHERAWSTCSEHFIAMCCGRSVHKTQSMIEMLFWWMANGKFILGDPGIFVLVPNKAQRDIAFRKIIAACDQHWFIRNFVKSMNRSDGVIEFSNGFQLLMRLAGEAGKETNVIGIHTSRIWVDEAQDLPYTTWLSLQNCLKEEIAGFQMIVSGVPNGGRQENVLYESDQLDERFTRYNISQEMMSWWTPEMEAARRSFYKSVQGEDSEDYKHFVLGQHGAPAFNVFDRSRFELAKYEAYKEVYGQNAFDVVKKVKNDIVTYPMGDILMCPPVPQENLGFTPKIGLGYDPGFSPDPAVFLIIYQDQKTGDWRPFLRTVLQRVEYPIQLEVMRFLDSIYNFDFIGMDMGGIGKVQYQNLTGEMSPYKDRRFKERVFPVEFGGYMVTAIDAEGTEKKNLIKRVAVEMLVRWVYEKKLVFSKDDNDLIAELERTKFTRTITGESVYKTDDDHQMSALMCALMAYEREFGVPVSKPEPHLRLLSARWLDVDKELGVAN